MGGNPQDLVRLARRRSSNVMPGGLLNHTRFAASLSASG
jgi:hypothetical protein